MPVVKIIKEVRRSSFEQLKGSKKHLPIKQVRKLMVASFEVSRSIPQVCAILLDITRINEILCIFNVQSAAFSRVCELKTVSRFE